MAEPESIAEFLQQNFFLTSNKGLSGKKALVTAGPTYEPIDPVRFIGNHSSGKMGWELAAELKKRGAEVILVSGPTQLAFADNGIKLIRVNTAEEMFEACTNVFDKADITIMAAAVADYTPEQKEREKIKKKEDGLTIKLTKTKDILQSLGTKKKKGQFLAGFALETNNEEANAIEKLKKKNADMIVLNSLNDTGAGFGHDTNKVTIFTSKGDKFIYETRSKTQVAKDIIDKITELYEV